MACFGSIEFSLTWRRRRMPSGRRISRLLASPLRTPVSGFSSWPTPVAKDDNKSPTAHLAMKARMGGNRTAITSLQVMAKAVMEGWPTPRSREIEEHPHTWLERQDKLAQSETRGGKGYSGIQLGVLTKAMVLGWPTATAITNSGGAALCKWGGTRSRQRLREAVGDTVLNGALNPEFPCWLMGYPTAWNACADLAMPSSRKSRRSSSKAI
jgi:hypothetical protein